MDFSLTAILSTLAPPAAGSAPSGKSKRSKKAKSDAEGPSTDAAEAVEPVVEQRLAAAFGAAISGEEPALLPPTALENTKKRKLVSIDDLEGELGEAEEQEKGKPSKSALKRAAQRESRERLGRTVFIGNLEPLITGKEVKRLAAAILAELPGIALDALVPRRARGAVDEDEVPQDDEDEEEDQPDLDDLNESDVPTSDDEDGTAGAGTATLPPGTLRRIESVRLRSVPISGTAVASGSDYKMMRKVQCCGGISFFPCT